MFRIVHHWRHEIDNTIPQPTLIMTPIDIKLEVEEFIFCFGFSSSQKIVPLEEKFGVHVK